MRFSKKKSVLIFVAALLILCGIGQSLGFELPKWFPFSTEHSLGEWENKIFKGKVIYEVERSGSEGFLHALSIRSASAIFYRVKERFRPEEFPMISWKWKIARFPSKDKLKVRQGIEKDDYAARVYVIFPSINFTASKALEYVWDESVPVGTIYSSPYSKNIKLIVVNSGADELGKWVFQERNIFEDYRQAFGRKPKLKVGAIALMSDADNTADMAEAYFDEINIGYRKAR